MTSTADVEMQDAPKATTATNAKGKGKGKANADPAEEQADLLPWYV